MFDESAHLKPSLLLQELDWLLQMYTEQDEIDRVKEQMHELDNERDAWLRTFEMDIEDEERDLDRREEEEETRLSSESQLHSSPLLMDNLKSALTNWPLDLEQEEEDNALGSVKKEQFELIQQRKNLVEHYEEMKSKITSRL